MEWGPDLCWNAQQALFAGAFRLLLPSCVCKQKAPQMAFAVISCFASWKLVISTICLHTKLAAFSEAAKQI